MGLHLWRTVGGSFAAALVAELQNTLTKPTPQGPAVVASSTTLRRHTKESPVETVVAESAGAAAEEHEDRQPAPAQKLDESELESRRQVLLQIQQKFDSRGNEELKGGCFSCR